MLYQKGTDRAIAIIEAKKGGVNLEPALKQATEYAEILEAPLIFAVDGAFCKTKFLHNDKPLIKNETEVQELLREIEALKFTEEFLTKIKLEKDKLNGLINIPLDKIEILNTLKQYLEERNNKPSNVPEFVIRLKEIGLIPKDSNPAVAIGSFLRSDSRFYFLKNKERQWILKTENSNVPIVDDEELNKLLE